MITKTYQAESMIQALKMIQEELGSEAIVLSVRELQSQGPAWQRKQKAGVEVVAMTSHLPERTVPVEAAPQSQKTAPVLRANPNNGGIEFIEETPVIEWEQDDKILKQPGSKRKEDDSSAKWQPKRLTRDEVIAITAAKRPPSMNLPTRPSRSPERKRKRLKHFLRQSHKLNNPQ